MAYTKTVWKDRVVQNPRTYTKTDNADGSITLTPKPGVITEEGTPISAANMNRLENAVENIDSQLGEMEKYALRSQGSYVGDGVAGREIIVGFNPKYVCIMCFTNPTAGVIFVSLNREYSLRQLGSSTNQVQETRLSENGFYVGGTHNTANGIDNIYYYFIIG